MYFHTGWLDLLYFCIYTQMNDWMFISSIWREEKKRKANGSVLHSTFVFSCCFLWSTNRKFSDCPLNFIDDKQDKKKYKQSSHELGCKLLNLCRPFRKWPSTIVKCSAPHRSKVDVEDREGLTVQIKVLFPVVKMVWTENLFTEVFWNSSTASHRCRAVICWAGMIFLAPTLIDLLNSLHLINLVMFRAHASLHWVGACIWIFDSNKACRIFFRGSQLLLLTSQTRGLYVKAGKVFSFLGKISLQIFTEINNSFH